MSALLRLSRSPEATFLHRSRITPRTTLTSHFPKPSTAANSWGQVSPFLRRARSYHSGKPGHGPSSYESNNKAIIRGLIGVNVAVFGYGIYLKEKARQGSQQGYIKFLQNCSLNLRECIYENRWWQLLTSNFTHLGFMHLLCNMVSIYAFGSSLASIRGFAPARLLTVVLGSGLMGSATYLATRMPNVDVATDRRRALGFSSIVMGVGSLTACLNPHARFLIYGIVPVPLWALVGGYCLYDAYYLNDTSSQIAHAGHLGGTAFGLLYYLIALRGRVTRF